MSFEINLVSVLKTIVPRVFPDVAPQGTDPPYITWQAVGGKSLRFVDNQPASDRNTLMQVNVWCTTRLEALSLIRQVEDQLTGSNLFLCTPVAEPMSTNEPDTELYGSIQRFSIYSSR